MKLAFCSIFVLVSAILGRPPSPQSTSIRDRHAPIIIHERHGKNATSTNWSGYAVTGARDSVTAVKASWIVPAIQGSCPATSQYSSFWVGIDGYDSNTVEQIGTDSDCQNGSPVYYAWFEFYPHPAFTVNSVTIQPGDVVAAEVNYSGGRFTVSLTNVTTGQTFSTSAKMNNAKRLSAEWIAEAPSGGGVLPLANFGTVSFGQKYTPVPGTCFATVRGSNGSIGSFSGNTVEITMVTKSGTIKAQPTPLSHDGSSFTDSWMGTGQ
jgi:hypothetical protein